MIADIAFVNMRRPGGDEAADEERQHAEQAGDDRADLSAAQLERRVRRLEPGRDGDRTKQHEQGECRHDAGDDRAPADQVAARDIC